MCVSPTAAWQEAGVKPLLKELAGVGGFPMINSTWSDADFDWLQSLVVMRTLYSANYLFGIGVALDAKNSSLYVIHVSY